MAATDYVTEGQIDALVTAVGAAVSPTVRTVTGTADTLVAGDAYDIVRTTNASAVSVTVPPSSSVPFPTGTVITVRGAGTGIVTLVAGAGVTINATPSLVFRAQHSGASLVNISTDVWDAFGDFETP